MELKTNYQYTYFIYPFVIKENRYRNYITKMLKNDNCSLKVFEKEKDLSLYQYFLPKTRDFLFSSFSFMGNKLKKFNELPLETKVGILCKYPCNIFEYKINNDIQGKVEEEKAIYFNIPKVEIICFSSGICFLCMKTTIEGELEFSNILNFNYKFNEINQEEGNLNSFDNIKIQTNKFENIQAIKDFIKNITGSNIEAVKLDLDTQKFLTYTYVCIDQKEWNNENSFERIEHNFNKLANILPADDGQSLKHNDVSSFSNLKYAKVGITKSGLVLFSSSTDITNYTILPPKYENQYLYTYILNLYKKIYLKKLEAEFKKGNDLRKTRKKFIEFVKKVWIQEITEDKTGTILNYRLQEVLELDKLYAQVKSKYDVLYKEKNIERNAKYTIVIAIILGDSLIINLINFFLIWNKG